MKKGRAVYQGGAATSLLFLELVGNPCPPASNPADVLLAAISSDADFSGRLEEEWARKTVPVDLSRGLNNSRLKAHGADGPCQCLVSWFVQFGTLFKRSLKQYLRRWDVIMMNLVLIVIISVFVGCGVWFQIGTDQASITKRTPSLFFASVTQGIVASLQTIANLPSERAIILRERAAGAYMVSAYFAAKTCVDFLSTAWPTTIFSCLVYFSIGYQPVASKFFLYWLFLLLDTWAALSLATMIACLCVSIEASTVALSIALEISRLYGGFFFSPAQLNATPGWRFADALSYLKVCPPHIHDLYTNMHRHNPSPLGLPRLPSPRSTPLWAYP